MCDGPQGVCWVDRVRGPLQSPTARIRRFVVEHVERTRTLPIRGAGSSSSFLCDVLGGVWVSVSPLCVRRWMPAAGASRRYTLARLWAQRLGVYEAPARMAAMAPGTSLTFAFRLT